MPVRNASEYPFMFGVDKRCEHMQISEADEANDPFLNALDYVYSRFKYCFHPQHPSMLWAEINSNKWMSSVLKGTLQEHYSMILETLLDSGFIVAVPLEQTSSIVESQLASYPLHETKLPFQASPAIIRHYVSQAYENWFQKRDAADL